MKPNNAENQTPPKDSVKPGEPPPAADKPPPPREIGGPKGLEPTRYRDWERGGRCIDF